MQFKGRKNTIRRHGPASEVAPQTDSSVNKVH